MPYNTYKNVSSVLKKFQIAYQEENFIQETPLELSDYFRKELDFTRTELVLDRSEYAICESLIYPVLKEVWKPHKERFMLWSHEPLKYDEELSGTPDYLITQKSPLGKVVLDQPYLIVVEAKKDNFTEGWGQCLAGLVAAQKLNRQPSSLRLFGIVSNGEIWEFGKLDGEHFTKHLDVYPLCYLDKLCAAINYLLEQCELQLFFNEKWRMENGK
jgi:hypothetical protein